MEYKNSIIKDSIKFTSAFKTIKDKGNLVYEYNPFRNYRLNSPMYEYENGLYTLTELTEKFQISVSAKSEEDLLNGTDPIEWSKNGIPLNISEAPILHRKGELVDFETDELKFDIQHPVTITPQYSYDNSVNLIINDGINQPRLINSRFSATERNKYQIVDRKGNNDTNIYDQGPEFDIDTSLHKKVKTIPKLEYRGIFNAGNLSIGNYHFYFKYLDADGNESDFIAESGLVSIFIGQTPYNIHTGTRNENSHKGVQFKLTNLDSGYQYLAIYYTKSTSDILENSTTSAFKIEQKYLINSNNTSYVKITGYEEVTEIPITDINLQYQIFGSVEAQAVCQNRLFFGNLEMPDINYKELTDISLRFCPVVETSKYEITKIVDETYAVQDKYRDSYYDSQYIYNKTGYWPGEIYRFGIVYILNDGTLTPVFNVRGIEEAPNDKTFEQHYTKFSFVTQENNKEVRQYIAYDETTNLLLLNNEQNNEQQNNKQQNCKGVIKMPESNSLDILGIKFILQDEEDRIIQALAELGVKGYFFVRQKRIPTILCQALTIGVDKESHTPVIPMLNENNMEYIAECFLEQIEKKNNQDKYLGIFSDFVSDKTEVLLGADYEKRRYFIPKNLVELGAICPEYDVDYPYYNTLFSGDNYMIKKVRDVNLQVRSYRKNHYYEYLDKNHEMPAITEQVRIQSVEDNQKLAAIDDVFFSARAGEAEEVIKYEYASIVDKRTEATNLIRGSYGPYLGLKGCHMHSSVINIYIPNYTFNNYEQYFQIRYNDKAAFYAISDRIYLEDYNTNSIFYRGDCYICQFTHRVNRNFSDVSAPTNDKIVDPRTWTDNYKIKDGVIDKESSSKINLGDINAIELGQWVTFTVRSSKNLNIRTLDSSNVDEAALFGHSRGFYPYYPLSTKGSYKISEALCYNKGFEKSVSERYNFEVPDVPALRNDFSNRISYSNIQITDAFQNQFRTFPGQNYRDYPKTYGSITKLIEVYGNLLCICEHGIMLIPVNERTVAGQGAGGNVYINTSNVLPENPKVISDTFGSQWPDSVIKTDRGIYGVDTIGKKIWRTNGETFKCISDFRIQEFLNQNISLTERELTPIIGIRNVKTHYNKFKGDVMFTFYDNLHGFEEKVWNICFNEGTQKWITFYSWVPSYSENIYNQYFSFDRNTSKYISKLGISTTGSDFADGITLENPIIDRDGWSTELTLSNRTLPEGENLKYEVTYELVRDNYGNYKKFKLENNILSFIGDYNSITSEFYQRDESGKILKDDRGRRIWLDREKQVNPDKIVLFLNIKAKISITYKGHPTLTEAYAQGFTNGIEVDAGYYQSTVAVIPKYNMQFLTTDFWKHGQAGIIDIADKIYPTYWYGKQHPFEFEFVVADSPDRHKIFDSLEIISNKAAPESFHYEIVGECYDFAKDKKNMYIRQEATKELYQFNGSDIVFNPDYKDLISEHRPLSPGDPDPKHYDKSTIFPLYYYRQDTINEIEDFYHLHGHKDKYGKGDKNFSALAGAEIVRYENLDEYRIWNHAKAVDIKENGLLRGNMYYKEDKWDVQINPINLVQRNESKEEWLGPYGATAQMVPAEYNLFPIPQDIKEQGLEKGITLPDDWTRNVISWPDYQKRNQEAKIKDRFIKIRIRYSGEDLAIISAIRTLYSISYA